MLKHIKLTTVSRIFTAMMLMTCVILGIGTLLLERNISLIDTTWELFQTDRSEKARLEGALRSAIGYGGMIHEFKNYVLRHEPTRKDLIQSDIGAARAVIRQYREKELSNAETVALEDIEVILERYHQALLQVERLIKQNLSIEEIDARVQIDDTPALRGLQMLRAEVREGIGPDTPLSKARISADLRATIGYGGMIHEFKNYVLRHDSASVARITEKLRQAHGEFALYRTLKPTTAEAIALDDIESTLHQYGDNVPVVTRMIAEGATNREIDRAVVVDDQPALRGLAVLDKEISHQIAIHSHRVTEALRLVEQTLSMSTWGVILLMLCVATGAAWLMQKHVITPILQLTDTMTKLANSDLSVTVDDHNRDNELGEMARTVMVFKQNMIERNRAEQQLSGINEEMNAQLENINQLREQSEDQATKALSLAEGLAVARESAEQAVARARQEELHIRSILNAVHDAIFTINTRGIIESVNPAATIIFGYRFDEMIGQNISMLMTDAIQKHHDVYLERFAEGASQRDVSDPAEQPARHKDGTQITVNVTLNKIILDGEMKIIGVVRDISARKQWEDEIKRLAMTDPLTGLANRNQYNRKLEEAAALSQRLQQPFALLLIDLDKFKPVNDTYGHPVGDALLQHVARILGNSCRDVDTVARLGGDEFAVILASTDKEPDIDTPAQRIIDQLSLPVVIEAHTIQIGASIGISLFPTAATDIEELQRQADLALYQAKADGRGTYRQFSQEITG